MFRFLAGFLGVADPDNLSNVLRPKADGSVDVNATVDVTIGDTAVANAADPTLGEGVDAPLSVDLSGHQRVKDAAVLAALGGILAVQTSFLFENVTTSTTTLVKTGAGVLRGVTVNAKGTIASAVEVYDGIDAGGTLIGTIDSLTLSGQFLYDAAFATGLTVVTTGTSPPDITVSYR